MGFWQGTETNSLANQTWREFGKKKKFDLTNFSVHLVTKDRVKLIENIFRKACTLNSDGSPTVTNSAGGYLGHDWGGHTSS